MTVIMTKEGCILAEWLNCGKLRLIQKVVHGVIQNWELHKEILFPALRFESYAPRYPN